MKTVSVAEVPILFENDDLLVINKPAGLLVHPTDHNPGAMSVTKLFANKLVETNSLRPGVVHRLDRDTSGVMVLAKTQAALSNLQTQFKNREVKKNYTALLWGHLTHAKARVELPIARSAKQPNKMVVNQSGKPAASEYEVMAEYPLYSLLQIKLLTGRTHQIRAQFSHMGHPVVGDRLYSNRKNPVGLSRQFLHATSLGFRLPSRDFKEFTTKLAPDLQAFLDQL